MVAGGKIQTTWFVTDFRFGRGILIDEWKWQDDRQPPCSQATEGCRAPVLFLPGPGLRDEARIKSQGRGKEDRWIRAAAGVEPLHHGIDTGNFLLRSECTMRRAVGELLHQQLTIAL